MGVGDADQPADGTSDEGKPADGTERFKAFWTSLPGVLTGVAAVIAAVVSLVALFGPGGSDDEPDGPGSAAAAAPPTVVSTGPSSPPATAAPGSSAGAGSGSSAAEAKRGSMELEPDDFADLGAGVVTGGRTTGSEFFLFAATDEYRLAAAIGQTFAVAPGEPDRAACAAALSKRQDRQLVLSTVGGRTVCVLTGDQRIAALTLTGLPAVGSPRLSFDYVLWP